MAIAVGRLDDLPEDSWGDFGEQVSKSIDQAPEFTNSSGITGDIDAATQVIESAEEGILNAQKQLLAERARLAAGRKMLRAAINGASAYVNREANGNLEIIRKSGLPVRRDPAPREAARKVEFLSVKRGNNANEVVLNWRKAGRNMNYRVQYTRTPEAEDSWAFLDSGNFTSLRTEIGIGEDGVNRYTDEVPRFYFRVSARSSLNGWGDWSEPVAHYLV